MPSPLDHRQVACIAAICREGSLGRAAAALGVTQPTLSKTIARLEDRLGLTLFKRSARGMVPTIFAEHVARRADQVGLLFAGLDNDLRAMALGRAGKLRIGLGPGMSHLFRVALVQKLLSTFPLLKLDVVSTGLDELFAGLRKGQFEFILANPGRLRPDDDFHEIGLLTDRLAFFGRADHPLACEADISTGRLLDFPCAFPYRPPEILRLFPSDRTPAQEENLYAFMAPDILLLREIVRSTDAVSYTLGALLKNDVELGAMAEIRLKGRWPFQASFIATSAAWHSPAVREIADLLREQCRAAFGEEAERV